MIAFEVIVASIWVALIKGIIGLLLLLPMIQRFFKLFEYNLLKSRKTVKIVIAILMIIFMVGVYFHMNLIKGICFCTTYYDENDSKGIPITTAMIRKFYPSSCPSGNKPCLVYATLPENGLNEVFINFHINLDSCKNQECHPSFEYRKYDEENVDNQTWKLGDTIKGEYESPSSEYSRRHIFTVLLKNLTPNTTYIFRVTERNWINYDPHIYSYKTFDTENIVIINGGDVGNGDLPMKMNKNVVNKIKADMIMIGGDIVYDNNVPHCYQAMDHFLMRLNHNYRDDRTNTTRVIPILLAPGNHDLGVIPYNEATLPHNSHEPIFKHYFPQNTFNGEIPTLNNRKTYFYHKIGDKLLIFSLDVGYEATMEGEQKDIMDDVLSKSTSKIKMAQFHGPIYAACGQDSYFDYVAIRKGLEHWVPLFDKHNMTIIFENHTHAFKRSKKLKNGVPNENGTIYLGEGNWGVTKPGGVCDPSNVEIHDKISLDQHVWIVSVSNSNITATAYTNTFTVIDSIVITYH